MRLMNLEAVTRTYQEMLLNGHKILYPYHWKCLIVIDPFCVIGDGFCVHGLRTPDIKTTMLFRGFFVGFFSLVGFLFY